MKAPLQFTTLRQKKAITVGRFITTLSRFGLTNELMSLRDPLYAYIVWTFADKHGTKV